MTNNHDQDAFELHFENAINNAHQRKDRGMNPSHHVWQTIRAGLPESTQRAETADPRASGPDPAPVSRKTQRIGKESGMDTALHPWMAAAPPRANRGHFAWVAITMVGVLIASSLFWFGQTPAGDGHNDIAWAPGLGTAESSPVAQAGESSCSVEPLTTDEVMETVLNPNLGYRRLGSNQAANSDSLWEPTEPHLDPGYLHWEELQPVNDPEQAELLLSMGNSFLNCLNEGTAFQVWSFVDPIVLQRMIISEFPVLRTEADLRSYIQTVGPQPFVESGSNDLTSITRFNESKPIKPIDDENALHFILGSDFPYPPFGYGIIRISAPGFSSLVFEMYVSEVSPDVWVIHHISSASTD